MPIQYAPPSPDPLGVLQRKVRRLEQAIKFFESKIMELSSGTTVISALSGDTRIELSPLEIKFRTPGNLVFQVDGRIEGIDKASVPGQAEPLEAAIQRMPHRR